MRITFKTTKLAKDKGFDQKDIDVHYNEDGEEDWTGMLHINGLSFGAVPTQSVLQTWLREVKGIEIIISPIKSYDYKAYQYGAFSVAEDEVFYGSNVDGTLDGEEFTTYELALEEALFNALENIE